ncbi:MAG: M48 family metalloprotease [Gammaproteobacteria bacterium]|nr:M48 family metalloprotease [Gammaproteobacteria bacterium]
MRKLLIIFFLLLNFVFCASDALGYQLPDLGEHSSTVLSPSESEKLGKEFMRAVQSQVIILNDPIINDYIQNLGARLVSHTSAKNKRFHFFVVLDPGINAFAGPDGYVAVNSGLIVLTRTESELAGVMAHEIAHVTQHHIERMIDQAQGSTISTIAGILAAAVIGMTTKGYGASNAATGAAIATMAGSAQHQINYTRENEAEADRIGMRTLYASGFDPDAMPNFFAFVQHITYSYQEEIPPFLADHPVTSERIADSKARASELPKINVSSSLKYYLIKARAQLMMFRISSNALNYFKSALKNSNATKSPKQIDALKYGYALALSADNQNNAASQIISSLIKTDPNEVLYTIADAKINTQNKNYAAAIAELKKASLTQKNYLPLATQYAETLLAANEPLLAMQYLKQNILRKPDQLELYVLLAKAAAAAGHKVDAYEARAKAFEMIGLYPNAILLLQQALKLPNLTTNEKAVLVAKLSQLQIELRENSDNNHSS